MVKIPSYIGIIIIIVLATLVAVGTFYLMGEGETELKSIERPELDIFLETDKEGEEEEEENNELEEEYEEESN